MGRLGPRPRLTGAALGLALVGLLAAFPGHGPASGPGGDPVRRIEPFVTNEEIRVVRIDPAAGDLWLLAGRAIHLPIQGFDEGVAAGCGYYSGLAVWSAENPGALHHRRGVAPRELAVIGPSEVLALGVAGLRLVRLGEEEPIVVPLMAGRAPPRFRWANRERIVTASRDGEFHHAAWVKGRVGEWTVGRAPGGVEITALGGLALDDLVAVGRRGAILEFDGRTWSLARSPTGADLFSIAASGAGVWVGGAGGTLLHRPAR